MRSSRPSSRVRNVKASRAAGGARGGSSRAGGGMPWSPAGRLSVSRRSASPDRGDDGGTGVDDRAGALSVVRFARAAVPAAGSGRADRLFAALADSAPDSPPTPVGARGAFGLLSGAFADAPGPSGAG